MTTVRVRRMVVRSFWAVFLVFAVYVLVAVALALLGLSSARAAIAHPDQGSAYAGCFAATNIVVSYLQNQASQTGSGDQFSFAKCELNGAQSSYSGYVRRVRLSGADQELACGNFAGHQQDCVRTFPVGSSCANRPDTIGTGPWSSATGQVRSGSVGCADGCETVYFRNGDGTVTGKTTGNLCDGRFPDSCSGLGVGYYWNPWLSVCETPPVECSAGQVRNTQTGECEQGCPSGMFINSQGQCEPEGNECPAGQVKAPSGACLPGEGSCAAGEVRRPDGTCGKDSDGDGEPDDDDGDPNNDSEKETFSGGDSCDSPPSCSGTPVMCGQARIQWRIDCNTRKNRNVSGGSCAAMPICTGEKCDAVEYSSLLMQWRTACALEKASGDVGGAGDNDDLIEFFGGTSGTVDGDAGGTAGMPGADGPEWADGGEIPEPDTSGFGYGSSCPSLPSIGVMGVTVNFNDYLPVMCQWMTLGGYVVLLLAGLVSLRIVSGGS